MLFRVLYIGVFVWIILKGIFAGAQYRPEYPDFNTMDIDTVRLWEILTQARGLAPKHPDSAILILMSGIRESKRKAFVPGITVFLNNLGKIYLDQGMYEKGLRCYQEVISYCLDARGKKYLSVIYNNIGSVHNLKGEFQLAASYYYKAMLYADSFSSPISVGRICNNLGTVFNDLSQPQNALYYLDIGDSIALKEHNYELHCSILINKAITYSHPYFRDTTFQYGEAFAREALNVARKYQLHYMQGKALDRLGKIYVDKKQPEKALLYLTEAWNINSDKDRSFLLNLATTLGEAHYMLHHYAKGEQFFLQAKQIAEKDSAMNDLINIYLMLARLNADVGNSKLAGKFYEAFINSQDSIRGESVSSDINRLEAKYHNLQKNKELLQKQLTITQQEKRLVKNNLLMVCIAITALALVILLLLLFRNASHKQKLQNERIRNLEQEKTMDQLKAVMDGEEKERARLARELHDGIGGMLASAQINLDAVQQEYADLMNIKQLDNLMNILQDTAEEVRKTAHNLMPDVLIRYNLEEALKIYCENIGTYLQIDLDFLGDLQQLPKSVELILYRTIQELLQNIIKHAQATHAGVTILQHENILTVTVEDNGKGFNTHQYKGGFGLQNLRYRVQALQGNVSISSDKGDGTTILIEFTLDKLLTNEGIIPNDHHINKGI